MRELSNVIFLHWLDVFWSPSSSLSSLKRNKSGLKFSVKKVGQEPLAHCPLSQSCLNTGRFPSFWFNFAFHQPFKHQFSKRTERIGIQCILIMDWESYTDYWSQYGFPLPLPHTHIFNTSFIILEYISFPMLISFIGHKLKKICFFVYLFGNKISQYRIQYCVELIEKVWK